MAITKCKECGKDVSSSAKKCPHCGVNNPGLSTKQVITGAIVLFVIFIGISKYNNYKDEKNKIPEQTVEEKEAIKKEKEKIAEEKEKEKIAENAICKKDPKCWGTKNMSAADVYCQDHIEKLAKYSHEWTDGMFESKFSHFISESKNKKYITYIGDKVKFQNGFGAWENYIYECDFDPETQIAIAVRANAGRL